MDYWLALFVKEIRRKDNKPYPSNTLKTLLLAFYMRDKCSLPDVDLFNSKDTRFNYFRRNLDARMKELTGEGIG